jgi:hypothetical protein
MERENLHERDLMGITPRGVYELFEQIEMLRERDRSKHINIFCSYL